MIKIASVVSARPQFIKHLPVHEAIATCGEGIKEILIYTVTGSEYSSPHDARIIWNDPDISIIGQLN